MAGSPSTKDEPSSLLAELVGIVPRLLDRTRRQAELSARALGSLPCLGNLLHPPSPPVEVPAHEATQPASVLSVLRSDDAAASTGPEEPDDADDEGEEPPPDVDSLPIPGYESLAASQVIPRLAALTPEELAAVGNYERATRHRQTILHRVAQLLAD